MKKTTLLIIIFCGLIISSCSNKNSFEFGFENFYGYFFTANDFTFTNTEANGLGYNLISKDIIKLYKKINTSGYVDNIIIMKKQTDKELKEFVDDTVEKTKIEGYKLDSTKAIKIRCREEKLAGFSINGKIIGNLSTTYFNHSFVKQDGNIYIISYSTQDEEERDTFSSDVKNIKCKK